MSMIKSLRVNNVVKITVVLLLAVLMLRCGQEQKIPVNTMQFTTVDVSHSGLDFNNTITETQNNNIYTNEYMYNGAGVAVGDINNDGLTDIYFIGNSLHNKLYLNKGDWEFEDITKASQTAGRQGWKTGVTMADVNGDGLLDIYICYSGNAPGEGYNKPIVRNFPHRANQLLINQGDGPDGVPVFKDQSKAYGLDAIGTFSTQAYFFDYDRDGDLDMLLLNHANMFYAAFVNTTRLRNLRHPYFGNKLYRNDNIKFV
ncbi:MAG: VCBS repeat-containing protein, partial [Cyclobacteriaceae bacterium]|nr:VCBS repeat-containing protein [Cyclobacteriaceae bacterium]